MERKINKLYNKKIKANTRSILGNKTKGVVLMETAIKIVQAQEQGQGIEKGSRYEEYIEVEKPTVDLGDLIQKLKMQIDLELSC